jgi:hypothetical protein
VHHPIVRAAPQAFVPSAAIVTVYCSSTSVQRAALPDRHRYTVTLAPHKKIEPEFERFLVEPCAAAFFISLRAKIFTPRFNHPRGFPTTRR